jgi:hypothetical protein
MVPTGPVQERVLQAPLSPAGDSVAHNRRAQEVAGFIREHGASFFDELVEGTGLLRVTRSTMSRTRLFISTGGIASHRLESVKALRKAASKARASRLSGLSAPPMSVLDEKNALSRSSTNASIPGRAFLSGLAGDLPPGRQGSSSRLRSAIRKAAMPAVAAASMR